MDDTHTTPPAGTSRADRGMPGNGAHRLLALSVVAVPVGWVMLAIPLLTDLPDEPFVLATRFLGLMAPAVPVAGAALVLRTTAGGRR